jgi:hypothetical protein
MVKCAGGHQPEVFAPKQHDKAEYYEETHSMALKVDAHSHRDGWPSAHALFVQIKAQGYRGSYRAVTDLIWVVAQ